MTRALWWGSLLAFVALIAVLSFRFGWRVAHLTETDVINAAAGRYVQQAGPLALRSDCVAVPGQRRAVWITVTCAGPGGKVWAYDITRWGWVLIGPQAVDKAPNA